VEVPRKYARFDVRTQPTAHFAIDFGATPFALFRRCHWAFLRQQFRMLGKDRLWKRPPFGSRDSRRLRAAVHKLIVDGNITAELGSGGMRVTF
jgi:hypothetical protein